jgi:hypothetical protein
VKEPTDFEAGQKILSRDGKEKGELTGASYHCRLDGCRGRRITTRWPGGFFTHPCSKGLLWNKRRNAWRIE